MFGDFILWIKHAWKEFWCIHNYEWTGTIDFRYLCCTKCGRITKRPNLEKGNYYNTNPDN